MKAAQAAGEEAPLSGCSVKVVLVGDGGCGKTSLMMVFADGAFPEVSALTLGLALSLRWNAPVCGSAESCLEIPNSSLLGGSQQSLGSKGEFFRSTR